MKNIRETVDLPDATVQPLVHPLDLSEARRPFLTAWWLSAVSPSVIFGLAAALWFVSNNYVTPILTAGTLLVFAILARRFFESEAWAHIPRKRQDRERALPTSWVAVKGTVSAVALLAGLVFVTLSVAEFRPPVSVGAYIVGSAFGVIILMTGELIWAMIAPVRLGGNRSRASQLATLVVTVAAAVVGVYVFQSTYGSDLWRPAEMLLGAGVIIAVQLLWWAGSAWPARRPAKA